MMMRQNTERLLLDALFKELDKLPLATWFTIEQLADASPDLQKGADGRYAIVGENASVSLEDLESVKYEVMRHAREAGLYVNYDYECGLSVHEYVSADEFAFDDIESMMLRSAPALRPFGATEIKYDGETLEMTEGWRNDPDSVKGMAIIGEEEYDNLRKLVARVDLPHWKRDYHNYNVLDGWGWNLNVWFKDKRVFVSSGSNAWPDSFGDFWDGLLEIMGLDSEWECPI